MAPWLLVQCPRGSVVFLVQPLKSNKDPAWYCMKVKAHMCKQQGNSTHLFVDYMCVRVHMYVCMYVCIHACGEWRL